MGALASAFSGLSPKNIGHTLSPKGIGQALSPKGMAQNIGGLFGRKKAQQGVPGFQASGPMQPPGMAAPGAAMGGAMGQKPLTPGVAMSGAQPPAQMFPQPQQDAGNQNPFG